VVAVFVVCYYIVYCVIYCCLSPYSYECKTSPYLVGFLVRKDEHMDYAMHLKQQRTVSEGVFMVFIT
jgi:hypothetical protein